MKTPDIGIHTIQAQKRPGRGMPSGSRGQSIVETALVLPILLLLVMAIIDFGLMFNNYIVLSNASREAARLAAVGATDADITALIVNLTETLDTTKRTTSISPAKSLRLHGAQVTITITYQSKAITPVMAAIFPGGYSTLTSKTIMRVE